MHVPLADAALLAHQGGWDEVLLVGGPIVLIIGLLAIAKRRVDRTARTLGEPATTTPTTTPPPTTTTAAATTTPTTTGTTDRRP